MPAKPCQEDWVELSSPGNTSSDAATLSLSHLQQRAETDLAKVEDGGRRQSYTLKSRRLRSLAETMLVSKVAEVMLGLVLVTKSVINYKSPEFPKSFLKYQLEISIFSGWERNSVNGCD